MKSQLKRLEKKTKKNKKFSKKKIFRDKEKMKNEKKRWNLKPLNILFKFYFILEWYEKILNGVNQSLKSVRRRIITQIKNWREKKTSLN